MLDTRTNFTVVPQYYVAFSLFTWHGWYILANGSKLTFFLACNLSILSEADNLFCLNIFVLIHDLLQNAVSMQLQERDPDLLYFLFPPDRITLSE
jgi:hypothetical protein